MPDAGLFIPLLGKSPEAGAERCVRGVVMGQTLHHSIEHFRDGKLLQGDQVVVEGVSGELACREKSGGRLQWHGFVEVPNTIHIELGAHLKLVLSDGRSAEINAADIQGSELPGRTVHAVEFYVVGDFHHQGRPRSLSHERRLGH